MGRLLLPSIVAAVSWLAALQPVTLLAQDASTEAPALEAAQHLFYNGQYARAAAMALERREIAPDDLSAYELRTSALHFQIRKAMGESDDKDGAFEACAPCPELMKAFLADIKAGQALARARLEANPDDEEALFFLGKIDLNYVWLQLGTLGKRTGWGEYREAKRSIDAVLKRNPEHVRARIARAWKDYIVDTKIPRGFRWILGGGNKKRALAEAREAADTAADFFVGAEARFALWEMQTREKKFDEAVITARGLVRDFPANPDLIKFLEKEADR